MKINNFLNKYAQLPYILNGAFGENLARNLAIECGLEAVQVLPAKTSIGRINFTTLEFLDGKKRYVLNKEILDLTVLELYKNKLLFLTKQELALLEEKNLLTIKTIFTNKDIVKTLSIKLQSKIDIFVNGIYIRESGRKTDKKIKFGPIVADLPNCEQTYLIQNINSTQASPDFVVLWYSSNTWFCLPLEDKSSKPGDPKWNSGLPQDNYLYVFSCPQNNRHFFCFGEDYCPPDYLDRLEEVRGELEKTPKLIELNQYLKEHKDECEFIELYVRPMYNAQSYDSSPNKIRNHNNALKKLQELNINIG